MRGDRGLLGPTQLQQRMRVNTSYRRSAPNTKQEMKVPNKSPGEQQGNNHHTTTPRLFQLALEQTPWVKTDQELPASSTASGNTSNTSNTEPAVPNQRAPPTDKRPSMPGRVTCGDGPFVRRSDDHEKMVEVGSVRSIPRNRFVAPPATARAHSEGTEAHAPPEAPPLLWAQYNKPSPSLRHRAIYVRRPQTRQNSANNHSRRGATSGSMTARPFSSGRQSQVAGARNHGPNTRRSALHSPLQRGQLEMVEPRGRTVGTRFVGNFGIG